MSPQSRDMFTSLCLWTILSSLLSHGSVYAKKQDEETSVSTASIHRARCASRCLGLHSTVIAALAKHKQDNGSLGWCQNHKQCAKCLEPCKESWDMKSKKTCQDLCERSFPKRPWECVTSCEFLRSVVAVKQGDCPPAERAGGFAAACVESCDDDGECHAQKKCCANGCGHTCQMPRNLYKGSPLKPRKELVFREIAGGSLEVRWSSRFNVSAEPTVNVLQRRWNYGIQPSEDDATPWQVVALTTDERAQLADTRPGRWYQFRVAAINIHGTRGFSTPSRHIHTTRDPAAPPAPHNLTVTNVTFAPGGVASVRLTWATPTDTDVPVHHYRVLWSCSGARGTAVTRTPPHAKKRTTVRGSQIVLDGLRSNSSYLVEVQSVSYWGQTTLRSPKTTLPFQINLPAYTPAKEQQHPASSSIPKTKAASPKMTSPAPKMTSPAPKMTSPSPKMTSPTPKMISLPLKTISLPPNLITTPSKTIRPPPKMITPPPKMMKPPRKVNIPQPESLLDVGTPSYQNGLLQVRVYWQRNNSTLGVTSGRYRVQWVAEHCGQNRTRPPMEKLVTQESSASLLGLHFGCKYRVYLQPTGSRGRSPVESIAFSTPSCAIVQARSPSTPIFCPGEEVIIPLPPTVLSQAYNLTANFLVHQGNLTALFSWAVTPPLPSQPITGLQVTWAEVTPPRRHHHHTHHHSLISQSQILPPDHSVLMVSGLRLGATYRLEVQLITSRGVGPVTTRTFYTPTSPLLQQQRPKMRIQHHQQRPIIERH